MPPVLDFEKTLRENPGSVASVFICYSHEDAAIVESDVQWLREQGIAVWYDHSISAGEIWREQIGDALDASSHVLFYVSADSVGSTHCNREINYALDQDKAVIPILLDNAALTSDLRLGLSRVQMIQRPPGVVAGITSGIESDYRATLLRALGGGTTLAPSVAEPGTEPSTTRRNWPVILALLVTIVGVGAYMVDRWLFQAEQLPAVSIEQPDSRKSIVVLPFINMSSDPEQEYFSDGISEELLNVLAQNPQLSVISRTSAFAFKGRNSDIPEVVRKLGVDYVLEGSVRKSGDTLRITTQLIDARTDTHLWSKTYDRAMTDVFATQDEISQDVAAQLNVTLDLGVRERPVDPEAYILFLQARHLLGEGLPENVSRAVLLLKAALKIDPDYVRAWTQLSRAFGQNTENVWIEEDILLPVDAVRRALEIDPLDGVANAWLGWSAIRENDLAGAVTHFQRGIELDPNNMDILRPASQVLSDLGGVDDLINLTEYVVKHDPLCTICLQNLSYAYMIAGRLAEAETVLRNAQALTPNSLGVIVRLGVLELLRGRAQEALALFETLDGEFAFLRLLPLHTLSQRGEAEKGLVEYREQWPANMLWIAIVYAWFDQPDNAFEWLGQVVENEAELRKLRFGNYRNPLLNNLHSDPRWPIFLEKIGRSPSQLAGIEFEINLPE